jgi:uncharacterized membrane protein (UPF0127 family)
MSASRFVKVIDKNTNEVLLDSVRWCSSHLCRLRGLQFHRSLKPGEGLILAKSKDTIKASSIHMFFVFFPITAVWINGEGIVTNAELAKPWRPYYASPLPARYVLETTPDFLERIMVGMRLEFR